MTESVSNIATELQGALQALRQRWQETTEVWDDPVRWQFEREFWQPLETQVTATQREMERLAHSIAQAQHSVH